MEQLRRLRDLRGLSQAALAAKIGGHAMTISKLERGERAPSLKMLRRLAAALDVPPAWLLDDGAPARGPDPPTRAAARGNGANDDEEEERIRIHEGRLAGVL